MEHMKTPWKIVFNTGISENHINCHDEAEALEIFGKLLFKDKQILCKDNLGMVKKVYNFAKPRDRSKDKKRSKLGKPSRSRISKE